MGKTTLLQFMQELMTWVTFTPEQLEKAKGSNINTFNHRTLHGLVSAWLNGNYDEDIDTLKSEIETLIPK
jgi:hypothetical protein